MSDYEIILFYQKDPLQFIKDMWGLVPLKEGETFTKGKHISPHQYKLLKAVEDSVNDRAPRRISVRSGHGVGKSCCLAWIVLWFLFCYPEAQVPCTAPTSEQMYDVLWKEIAKWMKKMPEHVAEQFDWTSSYIRMRENPETWFARARTARKEAPEALAGIHGDYVLFVVDKFAGATNLIEEMTLVHPKK